MTTKRLCVIFALAAALMVGMSCNPKESDTKTEDAQGPTQTQQRQYRTQQSQQYHYPQPTMSRQETTTRQRQQAYQEPSAQTVYVAPYGGQKYHVDPNCWGLKNARSVEAMTKQQAIRAGYQPCGICAR